MKSCEHCQHQNQEDDNFCYHCGAPRAAEPTPSIATQPAVPDIDLWEQFIGPNAKHYLGHFEKFRGGETSKFTLTWNWPAFLYISFLWFLYRKMYVYAFVYALGPMLSTYLTGDFTVGLVWSITAGATANYLYYGHCHEHISELKKNVWTDPEKQREALNEAGGVQPYVLWVGVALYIFFAITMIKLLQDGLLGGEQVPPPTMKPTATRSI